MEQLKSRFVHLLETENHPVRRTELRTFNRLLYRNRNQHRHGFYFRKLEEVRRILQRIDQHIAWNSIQQAVGSSPTKPHPPSRKENSTALAISSITHQDLNSLGKLYEKLIHPVIPSAAVKVTTELVCRAHFLPFAITLLAVLSRIFTLEGSILRELRGLVLEVGLLLPTEVVVNSESKPFDAKIEDPLEDVGSQVVSPPMSSTGSLILARPEIALHAIPSVSSEIQDPVEASVLSSRSRCFDGRKLSHSAGEHAGSASSINPIQSPVIKVRGSQVDREHRRSLYDLIAPSIDAGKIPLARANRMSVSIPEILRNAMNTNLVKSANMKGTVKTQNQGNSISSPVDDKSIAFPQSSGGRCDCSNTDHAEKQYCRHCMENHRNQTEVPSCQTAALQTESDDSDMDDDNLDEIFGAIDNDKRP